MINKQTEILRDETPKTSFSSVSPVDPNKINYIENDPKKNIIRLVREYQDSSRIVQDIFNNIDPLGTLKDSNDAYAECTQRFVSQLDNQQITNLTRDQIETMVRNSFPEDQSGTPVSEEITEKLVNYIDSLKDPF